MSAVFTGSTSWDLVASKSGRFRHRWGGAPPLVHPRRKVALHRLCTFDLADRRLKLPFDLPELPLLYPFLYNSTWLSYTVELRGVQVLQQEITEPVLDFPYPGYPLAFPEQGIELKKPKRLDLSPQRDLGNPFRENTFDDLPTLRGRTARLGRLGRLNRIAILADLPQGPSRHPCPRPGCSRRLEVFCVIDPIVIGGVHLWDDTGEGEDVKIVFELCPRCSLIRATNQCT